MPKSSLKVQALVGALLAVKRCLLLLSYALVCNSRPVDSGPGDASKTLRPEREQLATGWSVHVHHPFVHSRCARVQWSYCSHLCQRHLQGAGTMYRGFERFSREVNVFISLNLVSQQAFNLGKREGFFLKSVDNAPLAKRRKLKMTSTGVETRWSSSSSSSSSSTSSSASATASKAQPKQTVTPKQS